MCSDPLEERIIRNDRPYRDLTEILRNSAFWTYYRQTGTFDLN
jgi:hypothetical protein